MEESLVLSDIKNTLSLEKSVTYLSLQNTFNVSPLESQLLLKKYINENKDSIATYLNYLTEDNVNHVLAISDCSLLNSSIVSLKNVETNNDNHIDLYMAHNVLDKRNPPIVSDEIYILSNTQPVQVNLEPPVKQEQTIKRNEVHQSTSKVTNSKSSSSLTKSTNSIKENKATKITTSFFSKTPVNESSSKPKVLVNDDSDFEFSDNDTAIPATQASPSENKSSACKKKIEKKLEVITFNDLTHSDIVGGNKSSDNTTKDSVNKSRLFENFENVSPKKSKSKPKRRRLVIESDDDDEEEDENDKVLVEASFEEPKRVVSIKSHPSKRFKTDNNNNKNNNNNNYYNDTPKHDEPDRVAKKQVFETTSKPGLKKVERTYKDEDGFLVVEKVLVPINSEDNVKSIRADKVEIARSEISVKPERKIGKKPQSKQIDSKGKQTNIMSFFQKN